METLVKKTRKNRGFSLIELLIVVAIILIIAAIAIPNLLRARISANEASAVGSVRTMNTAQVSYYSAYPATGFSATVLALGPGAGNATCPAAGPAIANACLIDSNLSLATAAATAKSGYYFNIGPAAVGGLNVGYTVGGAPASFNQSGVRGFCSSADGVIHANPSVGAGGIPTIVPATCYGFPELQ
jgi:type IV pilus assembly protein PilA